MKVRSLFDLITDAKDLDQIFDGVETVDQLISRLERLKRDRDGAEDLLLCLNGLRESVDKALSDTLEMSANFEEEDDDEDSDLGNLGDLENLEKELGQIADEPFQEKVDEEIRKDTASPENEEIEKEVSPSE